MTDDQGMPRDVQRQRLLAVALAVVAAALVAFAVYSVLGENRTGDDPSRPDGGSLRNGAATSPEATGMAQPSAVTTMVIRNATSGAVEVTVVPAPDPPPPPPSKTPQQAVVGYLQALTRALWSLESTEMVPYTTRDQWIRDDAYIYLNHGQNQAIEMELAEFGFTEEPTISAETTLAVLGTTETWRHRMWDLRTREPQDGFKTETYQMRYTVVNLYGGWLIHDVDVVSREEQDADGGRPGS